MSSHLQIILHRGRYLKRTAFLLKEAIADYDNKTSYPYQNNCKCELTLTEDYYFDVPESFPWKGRFEERKAFWETHDIETALSLFWQVHEYIKKR